MGRSKKLTVDEGRTKAKSTRRQNRLGRRALMRRLKRENNGKRAPVDFGMTKARKEVHANV
jgi:hypothetical protein